MNRWAETAERCLLTWADRGCLVMFSSGILLMLLGMVKLANASFIIAVVSLLLTPALRSLIVGVNCYHRRQFFVALVCVLTASIAIVVILKALVKI